jgi:hypothetical protein
VIHGRTHSDARGHLVVQETAHLFTEKRRDCVVSFVIRTRLRRVDRARKVAFHKSKDGLQLILILDNDGEGGIAKDLPLEFVRCGEKLCGGSAQNGISVPVALAGCMIAAGDKLSAGTDKRVDPLMELFAPTS